MTYRDGGKHWHVLTGGGAAAERWERYVPPQRAPAAAAKRPQPPSPKTPSESKRRRLLPKVSEEGPAVRDPEGLQGKYIRVAGGAPVRVVDYSPIDRMHTVQKEDGTRCREVRPQTEPRPNHPQRPRRPG